MGKIEENISEIKKELKNQTCTLVAISKTKPVSAILEAYAAGQRHFGENKVQELAAKYEELPKDIMWHMVGHLQRNKVKYITPFIHLIHSVDSTRLLETINKEAEKNDRTVNCLLQVHIADEATKFGFDERELLDFLEGSELPELKNIKVVGLMGMATFTDDATQVKKEFDSLKKLYDALKSRYSFKNFELKELSMGMSGDYKIALNCGSTMIRVGSSIFGDRNYG